MEENATKRTKRPDGLRVRVRFGKVDGIVVCSKCLRFLGRPSYSNNVVDETRVHARSCPICGPNMGKLLGYQYTGRCKVTLIDDNLGKSFTGSSLCQVSDEFNRIIGYDIAMTKASRRREDYIWQLLESEQNRLAQAAEQQQPTATVTPVSTNNNCVVCGKPVYGKRVNTCKFLGIPLTHAKCEDKLPAKAEAEAKAKAKAKAKVAAEDSDVGQTAAEPKLGTGEDMARLIESILSGLFPGIEIGNIRLNGKQIYGDAKETPREEPKADPEEKVSSGVAEVKRLLELIKQANEAAERERNRAGTPLIGQPYYPIRPPYYVGDPIPGQQPTVTCNSTRQPTQTVHPVVQLLSSVLGDNFRVVEIK